MATNTDTTTVTVIPVLYRDASNYKKGSELRYAGSITDSQKKVIPTLLDEGLYYLPTALGHRFLGLDLSGGLSTDDHPWQEMQVAESYTEQVAHPNDLPAETVDDLISQLAFHTTRWNERAAADILNIPQQEV